MKRVRSRVLTALIAGAALSLALGAQAHAAPPEWRIDTLANSTAPQGSEHTIIMRLANKGDAMADGTGGDPITISGSLPAGISAKAFGLEFFGMFFPLEALGWSCSGDGPGFEGAHNFSCESADSIGPHSSTVAGLGIPAVFELVTEIEADADGILTSRFGLSGAGLEEATTAEVTRVAPNVQFGIDSADVQLKGHNEEAFTQAGGHPFEYTTEIDFNTEDRPALGSASAASPVEPTRDVAVELPTGFFGNPQVAAQCEAQQLAGENQEPPGCPIDSQVGTVLVRLNLNGLPHGVLFGPLPLFNMVPAPGSPARFGFNVLGTNISLEARLRTESDYGISIMVPKIPAALSVAGNSVTLWGAPGDDVHDVVRACPERIPPEWISLAGNPEDSPSCGTETPARAFLRMPTSCTSPGEGLEWPIAMDSWKDPGALLSTGAPDLSDPAWKSTVIEGHEAPGYPLPPSEWGTEKKGVDGCESVPVTGSATALPTTPDTETPSGLVVHVDVPNPGLKNPSTAAIASSDLKKVKVTLPEGMTINPSQAEGLGMCSEAQYQSTRLEFHPDGLHGCPSDSKIGTVSVKSPLLAETIPGNVFIAEPYHNPFGSLLALYVVLEEPQRGVLIKLAAKVETDPATGQITTTFDDLPQQPFTSFDFRLREGARAPLATPPACGTYETVVEFTGHSDPNGEPHVSTSSFEIARGRGGSACPTGGTPAFKPGILAGARNNAAGAYSPFDVRLFRTDAEQQFTNFSIKLPPGVTGKLAGIPFCSDAAIAAARDRSGAEEIAAPSCPAASAVGRTLVGAGVGPVQTYVPGAVYLAGPYNGSALSIAAITAAKVGPFDLGTVVIRQALRIDPGTAEVFIDATGSDPLPHIIDGIPTKLRDFRIYVERPEFMRNPTSCDPTSVASTVLGSGLDFTSMADDLPVTVSTRFQAADCAALRFKPRLSLRLKGGTGRGAHPSLRAFLRTKPGEANIQEAVVTLPKSEFLENSHIGTVCTRVQYRDNTCPAASVYGYARAVTPLLDQPIEGPVYLRSSEHRLPDLVAALHGQRINIDLVGRIDSVKGGGIRTSFESVPDAPVSSFELRMAGGKKGLLVNSANICKGVHRSTIQMDAHNGKSHDTRPPLKAKCGKKGKKRARRHARRGD